MPVAPQCVNCRQRRAVLLMLCGACLLELQRLEDSLMGRVIVSRLVPVSVDPDVAKR